MSKTARDYINFAPATTASEVILQALEYWGEHGERWIRGALYTGSKVCFYGGLSAGAYGVTAGRPRKMSYSPNPSALYSDADKAYKQAEKFILDELEERGYLRDIITFNDSSARNFVNLKKVACGALHRALEEEGKREGYKERRLAAKRASRERRASARKKT
jgi:hypothetical protein